MRSKVLHYLLSFSLIFCVGFGSSLTASAAGELFASYRTWVESPDQNVSSWVSGTSSTNGDVSINIDIIVSSESVSFVGSGNTGYNGGLFVSSYYVHQGDLISFDYINNLSLSSDNGWLRYGLKSSFSPDGLVVYNPDLLGTDILESINIRNISGTQKIEFTASYDGYFYLFCYTNSSWPANYTISGLTVNGISVKNEIVQAIEDQYKMEDGEDFGINDVISQHNDKMGVLSFSSDALMQVLGLLSPDQTLSSELVFPSMSLTIAGQRNKVQLWPEYRFDLNTLKQHWPDFIGLMQSLTTALVWIFVLRYCYRVFEKYFLAGGGN